MTNGQEENLVTILRKHKEAIGWTMTDIKGLSPAIIQHRIHLNETAKPKRDRQRRLNPIIQEVIRAKIVKHLDNEIIYLISDSNGLAQSMRSLRNLVLL